MPLDFASSSIPPCCLWRDGNSIIVAGQVSGVETHAINKWLDVQLPFIVPIVLVWIMAIMDGWRGVRETFQRCGRWWVIFHCAVLTSNYIGPGLPDITAAIASLVSLTLLFKNVAQAHIPF